MEETICCGGTLGQISGALSVFIIHLAEYKIAISFEAHFMLQVIITDSRGSDCRDSAYINFNSFKKGMIRVKGCAAVYTERERHFNS